ATAFDEVGLSYATSTQSVVDNTQPMLMITAPSGSSVVTGQTNITFWAQDGITPRIGTPTVIIAGNEYLATAWGVSTGITYGTYTWNTGSFSDRVYLIQVKGTDTAGNVGYSMVRSLETDNTPNAISLITPAASSRICGTITCEAVADGDAAGVVFSYEYPQGSGTWTTIGTDTSSVDGWCSTWITGTSGTYAVMATSYNTSGTIASDANYNVIVDNEAPSIGVAVNSIVGGKRVATVTATNVSPDVVQVVFEAAGSSGTYTIGMDTTSPYEIYWNPAGLSDGTVTVIATAIDLVGLKTQASTTTRVDNTAPVFNVDYPAEYSLIKGTAVDIRFSGMDAATQIIGTPSVSIDGGAYAAASVWSAGIGTYSTSLNDGEHTVRIKGTDTALNIGYSRELHFRTDAAAPTLSISASPNPASGSVRICVAASEDLTGAPIVSVTQNGATASISMSLQQGFSRKYEGTYTVISGNDGTAVIMATATDRADSGGNVGTGSGSFVVDTTKPVGTISINSGATYTTGTGVTLGLVYSSDVTALRYRNEAGEWTPWEGVGTIRQWLLSSGANGVRSIEMEMMDAAGNVGSTTDSIIYDATLPTGTVSVNSGAVYATTTSVTLALQYGAASDVASIGLSNDGVTWTTVSGTPSSSSWTLEGSDGTKWVYFRINDASGLQSSYADSIILDRQGPGCHILVNEDDLYTNDGTVTLNISASDEIAGMAIMSMSNNGTAWSTWQAYQAGTLSWSLLNGAGSSSTNGYRFVHVRFMDNAGNVKGTTSDRVVYDNTLPSGTLTINENAAYSTSRQVRLNISWDDNASGVEYARFGTDGTTLGAWEAITGSRIWRFGTDGTQSVYMQVQDRCGNTSTVVSDTIVVDTGVPAITVSSPASSAVVKGTVSITFSVSEAVVGTPSISLDGAAWAQVSLWSAASGQGTYTWNTAGVSDDSHIFQLRASDAAGNMGISDTRLVVVGNASTPVTIVTPLPNAVISGNTLVKATAPETTLRCEFEVGTTGTTTRYSLTGNSGTRTIDTNGSDGWCGTWTTSGVFADGTYSLTVYAYDNIGEIGSDTVQVTIDNTQPIGSVSVASPVKGAATVTYNSSETDITQVVFEYASIAGTYTIGMDTTQPFNVSWNTVGMVDGTYTIVATAKDRVNLSYAASTQVLVDNTPPAGTVTQPAAGAVIRGTVAVGSNWTDSHSMGTVMMRIDGGTWTTAGVWDTSNLADGGHSIRLSCTDSLGNIGYTDDEIVIVDNTGPIGAVSAPAYTSTNSVTLTLSYHDATSQVVSAGYGEVGQGGTPSISWTGALAATHTITLGSAGVRTIYYLLQDTAGNISTVTTTITYDGTAPKGTVTINSDVSYTNSRFVTLRLEYSDDATGVDRVRYSNESGFSGQAWEMPNVVKQWELSAGDDSKTVYYSVRDGAGNVYLASDTIILDSTPPATLTVSSPANGATYQGSITLTARAYDTNAVDRVEFFVDGVLYRSGGGIFDGTWATTAANDGVHSVYFNAYDAAGNGTSSQMMNITVDNTPPESVMIVSPANNAH
ncbi:hypothetical protein KKG56_12320, partial [bacterium]|nr:hypothetical protein [bacterium]